MGLQQWKNRHGIGISGSRAKKQREEVLEALKWVAIILLGVGITILLLVLGLKAFASELAYEYKPRDYTKRQKIWQGQIQEKKYTTCRLKKRITSVLQDEKRFEILKEKYENDKEFGFTEEERNKASILREAVVPKIRQAQETLVYYKRLWGYVNRKLSGPASTNSKIRMDLAKENFENNINGPVTDDERSEYGGWQKGRDNFPNIDLAGLTGYTGEGGNLY